MTVRHYIPNQERAEKDQNPSEKMLKNRAAKLADERAFLAACRFISAKDYAEGKRFPKQVA